MPKGSTKPKSSATPTAEVKRLGPDWLDKHLANKKNATVYKVEYDSAEFVPAATVVQRLNELKDIIAKLREEHPDWKVGDHRRHILKEYPEMLQFYKTHKTFFLNITRPDLTMQQADEMYRLCYFRELSEQGKLSESEAEDLAKTFVTGNHLRPMTPQQQMEYKKTGRVPDEVFDKNKMGYLMNRFKLKMTDKQTGESIEVGPAAKQAVDVNEDGIGDKPFQTAQPPAEEETGDKPVPKTSSKSKREEERKKARRERILQHQQKK